MINVFIQGEDDEKLFSIIGKWVVNKKIHDEIRMPITGEPGDIWIVSNSGEAIFCQLRLQKNKKGHIRILYASNDTKKNTLINKAESLARNKNMKEVYVNDLKDAVAWVKRGYSMIESKQRGEFRRWEKKL